MKKLLATLRKRLITKRTLLVGGYLLVIAVLLFAVSWRSLGGNTEPQAQPPAIEQPEDTDPAPVVDDPDDEAEPGDDEDAEEPEGEDALPTIALPNFPMIWPVVGQIITEHHEPFRIGSEIRANVGVDIEAPEGTEVKAAWPGVVDYVDYDQRLGWYVEIRHGGNYVTRYANLKEEPFFSVGDEVNAGQVIGIVGQSAKMVKQQGEFLQFAVFQGEKAVDPVTLIEES